MGQAQQKSSDRPVVLILGGGYGGVALAKLLDESGQCFVLLVDQKEFFHHKVATPRALARKHYAHSLLIPYDKLLRNGVVICGVVSSISPRSVSLHGRVAPLTFDFLVIATGAKYSFPFQLQERRVRPAALQDEAAAGASRANDTQAACGDESDADADAVPQPLFMLDTIAQYHEMHERVAAAKRILIVGGGCVGIETAGELAAQFLRPHAQRQTQAQSNRLTTVAPPAGVSASVAPASPLPPPPNPDSKEIVLLHSRAELMNRQTDMRDKMRTIALAHLRSLGVKVVLQERADLESIREVRDGAAEGVKSDRSGECGRVLQSQGFLAAAPGCSLELSTIKPTAPSATGVSVDELQAAPAFQLGGPHAADLVLLCTGVRHDARLFEADEELRHCVDSRGRLVVNQFMQLEGSVSVEKAVMSALAARDGSSLAHGAPGADSPLHSKFSFHNPHVFALGDCCVPLSELAHSINPQAYHAHRHAQTVARNILNMIGGYALKPWEGAGPLSLFLSIGPVHGVSQLPNSQNALAGDAVTRLLKSADMQVAANWAFLNQDPARPSFKGHASAAFATADQGKPLDSSAMSAQAKRVQAKMAAFSPSARLMTVVAPAPLPPTVAPQATAASAASASAPAPAAASAPASHSSPAPESQWSIGPARASPPPDARSLQMAVPPAATLPSSSAPAPATSPAPKGVSVVVDDESDEEDDAGAPPARFNLFSPSAASPMGPILMAGAQEDGFEAAMRAGRDVMDTVEEGQDEEEEERLQQEEEEKSEEKDAEEHDSTETAHDAPSDLAATETQLRQLSLPDSCSKDSSSQPSSPPAAPDTADDDASETDLEIVALSPAAARPRGDEEYDSQERQLEGADQTQLSHDENNKSP